MVQRDIHLDARGLALMCLESREAEARKRRDVTNTSTLELNDAIMARTCISSRSTHIRSFLRERLVPTG